MSDLQCAATFLVLPAGSAIPAEQLLAERPACLYTETGLHVADLARGLGLAARHLPGTRTPTAPAALTAALTALADEFRGETLAVVVSDATYADLTREVVSTSPPAVVVEIDADSRRWRPYE